MIRLGLVGYPLEHSLSPVIHYAALSESGLQGDYALYPVDPGRAGALHDLVQRMRRGEIQGLNVTIPYKRTVIGLLDALTPAAQAIGAVNTIYLKDAKVVGDNTDSAGFMADLREWGLDPKRCMVLGAGGAARAVVHALETMGCGVSLAARRAEQAQELARHFAAVKAFPLTDDALREMDVDLLVNATAAGMYPNVGDSAWPPGLPLPSGAAVYDLVYNPSETRLLEQARLAGLKARNGLGMLIEQAALAFELWTGCSVPRSSLEAAVRQAAR